MRSLDGKTFTGLTATSNPFTSPYGGKYLVGVVGTFNGGSVELQQLGPDGATYVSLYESSNNGGVEEDIIIGKFTANGSKIVDLAAGTYQFTLANGATGVSARAMRIPGE